MEVMSATQFRSNLFRALKKVLMGFEIKVKTKDGNVLLINEKKYYGNGESRKTDLLEPKAKGSIVGSLDDADQVLRDYIKVPGK